MCDQCFTTSNNLTNHMLEYCDKVKPEKQRNLVDVTIEDKIYSRIYSDTFSSKQTETFLQMRNDGTL